MRRKHIKVWVVAAALGLICGAAGGPGGRAHGRPPTAEWTVMVFLNGKNNLEPFAFRNYKQMYQVGSTDQVNVLVEFGRPQRHYTPSSFPEGGNWSKTLRFRVEKDKKALEGNALEDLGKVDMGKGTTLTDFVAWSKANYPAKRYLLVIWDHGQGWRDQSALTVRGPDRRDRAVGLRDHILNRAGRNRANRADAPRPDEFVHGVVRHVSHDEDTGNKLYNRDIQDSLRLLLGQEKLDVIGFDACLMSMIETGYALREVAQVMVASQELEPGDGWNYALWLKKLVDNPTMDAKQLGQALVASYREAYNGSQ